MLELDVYVMCFHSEQFRGVWQIAWTLKYNRELCPIGNTRWKKGSIYGELKPSGLTLVSGS